MYRAQNIHGWSLFSPIVSVKTMTEPHATNLPVTEVVGTNVRVSWDLPYSGGNDVPITGYQVLVKRKDGVFIEDTVNCNGQLTQSIVDNRECFVPMALLISDTDFNLDLGDLVVAKVAAINSKGNGQFSGTNILGALVQVPP